MRRAKKKMMKQNTTESMGWFDNNLQLVTAPSLKKKKNLYNILFKNAPTQQTVQRLLWLPAQQLSIGGLFLFKPLAYPISPSV